jgi:hypothetical protein
MLTKSGREVVKFPVKGSTQNLLPSMMRGIILFIKKMFPKEGEQSSASGFLKLKGTAYFKLDWFPAVVAKFQGLISMKVLPLALKI